MIDMIHLDDGTLIRLLDSQGSDSDAAHVAHCDECAQRLAAFRSRDTIVADWLVNTEALLPAPPADSWTRITARAESITAQDAASAAPIPLFPRMLAATGASRVLRAAVVLLIVGGVVTAEPVREWLAANVARLVDGPPDAVVPAPPVDATSTIVRFVPRADMVTISFAAPQAGGVMRIHFEQRSDASAEAITDATPPALLVRPDGFHVRNGAADDAHYEFRLPATLARVRVQVGDRIIATLSPGEASVVEIRLNGDLAP